MQRHRAVTTRNDLVAVARALFTQKGYAATGTDDVALGAAMTRGALYHHFTGKEDLFEAVFREVLETLNRQARQAAAQRQGDLWGQVAASFTAYLTLIATQPEFQQILLIDGPAVLGWRRWRELQSEYIAAGTAEALRALMQLGVVVTRPCEPLANMIQACLNDAALTIAYAADPQVAGIEANAAFMFILEGMRSGSPLRTAPDTD